MLFGLSIISVFCPGTTTLIVMVWLETEPMYFSLPSYAAVIVYTPAAVGVQVAVAVPFVAVAVTVALPSPTELTILNTTLSLSAKIGSPVLLSLRLAVRVTSVPLT